MISAHRMPAGAGLVVAAAIAALLLAGAAVLRLSVDTAALPLPDRLGTILIGAALLIVGLLALPRLPGLAWTAIALAAPIGAVEIVAVVRSLEPLAVGAAWRDLALIAAVALVGAVLVDAAYAGRGLARASDPARAAILVVSVFVLGTAAAGAWAVLVADRPVSLIAAGELTPLRVAARIALATMAAAFLLGVARTLAPAAARAADRSRRQPADPVGGGLWRYLGMFMDELLPTRADARRQGAEAERARLAADLHAHVLPELRRAAAVAESAGLPAEAQVDLRRALDDVEQLMHQRQSIVLEQFGLVAALEWLAERTEERTALRVQLDLEGAVPDWAGAVDANVARAAFRIALLGLDNVVRHAGARTATLRLAGDPAGLRLTIEDDGTAATSFEASGGRGLADMRTAAAESGGAIRFVGGPGARIEVAWPAVVRPAGSASAG